jgi:hypothetical protein
MITGTSHFVSFEKAVSYYKDYDFDAADVRRKIGAGEIHIGKPAITDNQKLKINDEGRYVIAEIDRSEPTYANQLWHAERVATEKGKDALLNPSAYTGKICGCKTCYCCAAYAVARKKGWL